MRIQGEPHERSHAMSCSRAPATAHPSHTAAAQADSLPAGVTDETEQGDDELQSSRVTHIRRSRAANCAKVYRFIALARHMYACYNERRTKDLCQCEVAEW